VTALELRSGQVADAADFEIEPQGSSAKAPGVVDVVLTGQAVAVILGLVRKTMRGGLMSESRISPDAVSTVARCLRSRQRSEHHN
jgi:hypothetical protein